MYSVVIPLMGCFGAIRYLVYSTRVQYGDCYRTVCMEFFLSGHESTFLYELTYLFGSAFEPTATSEKEKRKLTLRQQHELSLEPLVSHTITSHLEIHVFSAFFQCLP